MTTFRAAGSALEVGACLGQTLAVAIAESLLHEAEPIEGCYVVAEDSLLWRYVWRFSGSNLKLLALHGHCSNGTTARLNCPVRATID